MKSSNATHHAAAVAVLSLCFSAIVQAGSDSSKATVSTERNLQVEAAAAQGVNKTQRVALVIGNSAYKEAPLTNPVNDERAIALALKESGFTVIAIENADHRMLLSALREFGDRLRAGGTGLFYYAGHGMQIKGRNYLIPVGASIEREDEVAFNAVDAQAVLDKMEAAGNPTNIMILDACRNNPFTRSTRSGQAGLAQMDAPVGTLVAYATSPGAVASDGGGANGLYTQHLLAAIRQPGNKIEDVFKQVRANVRRDSHGKQVPWEATSLEGDFYFMGAPASIAAPDPGIALDAALWDVVKVSNLAIEIRAYLNRYPNGKFAAEAHDRLAQLKPVTAVPVNTSSISQSAPSSVASAAHPALKVNVAPNAISQAVGNANSATHSIDDKAAVDRRTKELMTDLAVAQTVAAAQPTRMPPASNGSGFTVGDRWRYQTVDKVKMKVVSNWSRVVEAINNDGTLKLNGGKVVWTGDGSVKTVRAENRYLREFTPAYKWLPSTLKSGYSEPVKLTLAWQNTNGNKGTEKRHGTVQVMGSETIKVPAGEFEAWKIEFSGYSEGQNESINKTYTHRFKEISWYVPAVHNYVATENLTTDSKNRIVFFERQELTSYSVRGADRVAQK